MSLQLIEGFDTKWFRPDMDNSLVPIVPKWGYPVPDFAMPKTYDRLNALYAGGVIRSPLSVYTKLPLNHFCVGFRFSRTHGVPALLFSVWEGKPTETGSKLLCGAYVNSSGYIVVFVGGSWDKDALGFGLSGQTDLLTLSAYQLPFRSESFLDHIGNFVEVEVQINSNGSISGAIRVYDTNDAVADGNLFSGSLHSSPNLSDLFLWISSNYSYKDASGNYIAVHGYDDLYLVAVDGFYPSSMLGPILVETSRPFTATVTEWNVTSAGHVNAVNENWVSHPSNDTEYIYTDKLGVRELWKFGFVEKTPEPVVVGVQLTAWCNFQTFPPQKLAFVVRRGVSEGWYQPNYRYIADVMGNIGYSTLVFTAVFGYNELDDVEFGVMTGR
jgi:hypothetical protein